MRPGSTILAVQIPMVGRTKIGIRSSDHRRGGKGLFSWEQGLNAHAAVQGT